MKPFLAVAAFLAVGAFGCTDRMTEPHASALSVVPADGATGVRVDAPVVLEFGGSVNRDVVERSFHLLAEASMNDSLCSSDPGSVGDMAEMMRGAEMMGHMIDEHSVGGGYQWNGDRECVFTPDAPMTPGSRDMIYLDSEMAGMMGDGPMMGHQGSMGGAMALHFTTVDESSHESHHAARPGALRYTRPDDGADGGIVVRETERTGGLR